MKEKEWCIYVENVNVHVSGEVFNIVNYVSIFFNKGKVFHSL